MSQQTKDLATALALCCLIDDRSPEEQSALERLANALDKERNRIGEAVINPRLMVGLRVPCTFSDHHIGGTAAAKLAGVEKCKCEGSGEVPPFTAEAKAEPLTDQHGWSRALVAVRERERV